MKELSLEEVKQIELDLLIKVHEICTANSINYSIAYGTMIGAIRHRGFIPWDDDIDVLMTRPDYRKFISVCVKEKPSFDLFSIETNENYRGLFSQISAIGTFVEDPFTDYKGIDMGVHIDVIPVDGLGIGDYETAVKNLKATSLRRKIQVVTKWDHYTKSTTHAWYYEPIRFALYIATRFISAKKYADRTNRMIQKYDFNESDYVAAISAAETIRSVQQKSDYDEYVELEFEGYKFSCIKNYDAFLKRIYGDYMQLPPISQQVQKHAFKAYRLD